MARKKRFYWPRKHKVIADVEPAEIADNGVNNAENLTSDLSGYKWTGNPLFAWAILKSCIATGQPLPKGVDKYFANVAERLLKLAGGEKVDPRAAAKLVLGSNEVWDGVSIFEDYRLTQLHRKICSEVDLRLSKTYGDADTGREAEPATRTSIYAEVASSVSQREEYVKDVFENYERVETDMSFREVQNAIKSGADELPLAQPAATMRVTRSQNSIE